MTSAAVLDPLKNNCAHGEWWGPHLVEEMLRRWADKRASRDAQRVVIQKRDDPGDVTWFQPLQRHHSRYRNKQRNRVTQLKEYMRQARYLVTLTVDPKRYANDMEAYAGLRESWRKIYYRLRRRSDTLQAVVVIEPQKNGQPHLHALLWGVHLPQLKSWAAEMYQISSGYVHAEKVRHGNKAAVSYLGKYLVKGVAQELTLAALTRWGAQTLTVSGKELREHLGPLLDPNSTGEWVLILFVCSFDDAVLYFSEGFAEDMYEYPNGPPKHH